MAHILQLPGVLVAEDSILRPFLRNALIQSSIPWPTSKTSVTLQRPGPLASVQDISKKPPSSRASHRLAEASDVTQSTSPKTHPASLSASKALPVNPLHTYYM